MDSQWVKQVLVKSDDPVFVEACESFGIFAELPVAIKSSELLDSNSAPDILVIDNSISNSARVKRAIASAKISFPTTPIVVVGHSEIPEGDATILSITEGFRGDLFVDVLKAALACADAATVVKGVMQEVEKDPFDKSALDSLEDLLTPEGRATLLANRAMRRRQYQAGVDHYADFKPQDLGSKSLLTIGLNLVHLGKDTQAEALLRSSQAKIDNDYDCLSYYCDMIVGNRDNSTYSFLPPELLRFTSKTQDQPRLDLNRANILVRRKLLNPQGAELFVSECNHKGISLVRKNEFDLAKRFYSLGLQLLQDPTLAYKLWLNLGLCAKKSGDVKEAIRCFKKGQSVAPKDYDRFLKYLKDLGETTES